MNAHAGRTTTTANDGIQRDPQRRSRSNAPAAMATPHRAATATIATKTRVMVAIGYQREGETRTGATSCTMVVEAMLLTHARNPRSRDQLIIKSLVHPTGFRKPRTHCFFCCSDGATPYHQRGVSPSRLSTRRSVAPNPLEEIL